MAWDEMVWAGLFYGMYTYLDKPTYFGHLRGHSLLMDGKVAFVLGQMADDAATQVLCCASSTRSSANFDTEKYVSGPILSYRIISYPIIAYQTMEYHVMPCRIISCHIISGALIRRKTQSKNPSNMKPRPPNQRPYSTSNFQNPELTRNRRPVA